jgi:hypothetical protein
VSKVLFRLGLLRNHSMRHMTDLTFAFFCSGLLMSTFVASNGLHAKTCPMSLIPPTRKIKWLFQASKSKVKSIDCENGFTENHNVCRWLFLFPHSIAGCCDIIKSCLFCDSFESSQLMYGDVERYSSTQY